MKVPQSGNDGIAVSLRVQLHLTPRNWCPVLETKGKKGAPTRLQAAGLPQPLFSVQENKIISEEHHIHQILSPAVRELVSSRKTLDHNPLKTDQQKDVLPLCNFL